MKEFKFFLIVWLTSAFIGTVSGQGFIRGKVTDSADGKGVANAAVIIDGKQGVTSDSVGTYFIRNITGGSHLVEVQMLGYRNVKVDVYLHDNDTVRADILLTPRYFDAEEVVISATRNESSVTDIPARVNVISPAIIKSVVSTTVDDLLATVPGLNISRSFGIFSHKASITMRGLSGNEQARVLVLLDGIPVNKADGGSVNWNLLDPDMIERIEVVKGPGSAVYGSNAMGGTINIITRKPSGPLSGTLKAGYGTYDTYSARLSLSQHQGADAAKGLYYSVNGLWRQSDGYVTQSLFDQTANPYIVPSDMFEYAGNIKVGYDFAKGGFAETDFTVYNDSRGTGELVHQPRGNTTDHDTYQSRTRYRISHQRFAADVSLFFLSEDYKRVNEFMKDDYTYYKVLSERNDAGLLSSFSWSFGTGNRVSAGTDIRVGSVDARDVYYTSTDIVYNRGRMLNAGLFVQDEARLAEGKLKIVAGLRYDLARFYDGAFTISEPSGETAFMSDLQDSDMNDVTSNALSPRLSVNYTPSRSFRAFASVARGFRPSVLDDLCRSGRIRGGFKLANPGVKPEYMTSYESGIDITLFNFIKSTLSVFYSVGTDFMYYINTGDSIDMGFGLRPVLVRTNIPEVEIAGFEAEAGAGLTDNISVTAAFSYSSSVITRYRTLTAADPADLTGHHLTDVPSVMAALTGRWNNRLLNIGISGRYHGSMWVNDLNVFDDVVGSDSYPAYLVADLKLSRMFWKIVSVDLSVQNIFDTKFYDSKGAVCPGRFMTIEAGLHF